MLSREAMEDLTLFIQMAEDEGLEYMVRLGKHVKQLQIEILAMEERCKKRYDEVSETTDNIRDRLLS